MIYDISGCPQDGVTLCRFCMKETQVDRVNEDGACVTCMGEIGDPLEVGVYEGGGR